LEINVSPLIITPEVTAALHRLREAASRHPIDMPARLTAIETPEGMHRHRQQMTAQTIEIPGPWPFFVTFSMETGHPVGICRHLSMSIARAGRVPNEVAVWMIAEQLGFTGGLDACQAWKEELPDDGLAINLIQPVAH
jgi:hypothetical protein